MSAMPQSSRRRFLALMARAAGAVLVAGAWVRGAAAALPHLGASSNATARALHYTDDARKSAVAHPPMQHCMMCRHYRGSMGEAWGPCEVFPGFDVNAMGWCSAYAARKSMMPMMHGTR